jgi:hypothetical protein
MRFGLISLHRAWIAVAAILLALHWAAPSFKPLELLRQSGEADLAFKSHEAGSYRSTLPRVLARSLAFEAGPTKPHRGLSPAGENPDALPETARVADAHQRPDVEPRRESAQRPLPTAHAFEARGPPQASA